MAKKATVVKKAAAAVATKQAAQNDGKKDLAKKPSVLSPNSKLGHSLSDVTSAINTTYTHYWKTLTPRLKLIDAFLVFLVALGVLQFIYVLLIGNFPFNAFLGGFIACVGQFVLTVSLRMQYAPGDTRGEDGEISKAFPTISPERALGDFMFASLMLHFIIFHYIN